MATGRMSLMAASLALAGIGLTLWIGSGFSAVAQDRSLPPDANSTRKVRVRPGPLASQIGNGIHWMASVEDAQQQSAATGKPILWYIHTVPGTFMDRKVEIDRYMLAGPFSWNSTRELINDHFVPVKAAPSREQQQTLGLLRYDFVEPGLLILDADGNVLKRLDRLTTLHPEWWQAVLRPFAKDDYVPRERSVQIAAAWQRVTDRDISTDWTSSPSEWSDADRMEWEWLRGVSYFRAGRHQDAANIWKIASESFPDEPLAWKAAAEAEGFGPLVRGFEVYEPLSNAVLDAAGTAMALTSAAPAGAYDELALWERSVNYLLGMQRDDGGWLDSDYDFGGTDSLPNVHMAVTALCGLALIEAQRVLPRRSREIENAIERAVRFVVDDANLNRADRDELTWAYAYRVEFLARVSAGRPELVSALQSAVKDLEQFQAPSGGWFHEYRNPFVSGTALVALALARDAGAVVDPEQIDRGLQTLRGERLNNGAFPYSSRRGVQGEGTLNDVRGGVGRMPICELGLWMWNASNDSALAAAVARSFEYHELMQKALKYDDHTDVLAYGGFFFWYGVYGRSLAINRLSDEVQRSDFLAQQRQLILSLPEIDGCFVDSHELGRCYGTAMALLSLAYSTH